MNYYPPVGRYRPGSRPQRLERGHTSWRRFPNRHGGGAAVHPDDSAHYLEHGITFADGRYAVVSSVEREAYVDVLNFHFVQRPEEAVLHDAA